MKCKHCGKELMVVTMYVDASVYGQPRYNAAAAGGYVTVPFAADGERTIHFPNAAAAAGCIPFSFTDCAHEPAVEPVNVTSGAL